MRIASVFLPASLLCLLAACASSSSSPGSAAPPGPATESPDGGNTGTEAKDPPLTARPVCATVATGADFGRGCSGTGSGQTVCAFEDNACGTDKCVYDSRGDTFSFTCTAKCTVGDSTRCPLGYECVAPDASCAGDVESGVCVQRSDFTCEEISGLSSGTLIEGPGGELLRLGRAATGSQTTLSVRQSAKFKQLVALDDPDATIYGAKIARTSDSLLIVTSKNEILVKGGSAESFPHKNTTSSSPVYSSGKDGTFLLLEPQGSTAAYAALSKRNADGTWTEVGPTRQRLTNIIPLNSGFLARCDDELCKSTDGEEFTPIALPDGVQLESGTTSTATRVVAAGLSTDEFFAAIDGKLYHHRKGSWVTEGPAAMPRPAESTSSYADLLKVSSTGMAVYSTYNYDTNAYSTYASGNECWTFDPKGNLDAATPVKDVLVYLSVNDDVCSRPAK